MGTLFEVVLQTINEHLINLFNQNEISREATIRDFRIVQKEGSREVARNIEFYSLEAIKACSSFIEIKFARGINIFNVLIDKPVHIFQLHVF